MSNNAIIAKSRAIYGSFLKGDDYAALIHKPTITAAVAYLKTRPRYMDVFADTDEATVHRNMVEELIKQHVFDTYMRICKFSAGNKNGITGFLIKKLESDQVANAVIAISTGNQELYYNALPPFLMDHLCFDPAEVADADNFTELLKALEKTPYHKFLKPHLSENEPDINACIAAVSGAYMKWAFTQIDRTVKKSSRERVKSFFLKKADASNILMSYRLRNFNESGAEIMNYLLPYHYRLKPSEIDAALRAQDSTEALTKLFLEKKLADRNAEDRPLEISIDSAVYSFFRRRLSLTTDETEALYSLIMLFDIETANISRIIEGIRYGLLPEEIEKYVII